MWPAKYIKKYINECYKMISTFLAIILCPFVALLGWIAYFNHSYLSVTLPLAYVPFVFGEKLRYLFYKLTLKKLGTEVTFKFGSFCNYRDITIGNRVYVGCFNSLGRVFIGDDVLFGGYVNVLSGRHQHGFTATQTPINQQPGKPKKISIGSDIWIGSNSVILNNVGNHGVVGAGAVVVNEVANNTVVAGNPSKLIRNI